jgi:hypothetical protein
VSTAYLLIRREAETRYAAFVAGLERAGYAVAHGEPRVEPRPGDVLLLWNRRGQYELLAERFEARGAPVLVAENGYIGRDNVALARGQHNGGGRPLVQDPSRRTALGVEALPWRAGGSHVLVCPNRFIGPRGAVMPYDWVARTLSTLARATRLRVKVRPHPGRWRRFPPKVALEHDLKDCWACVIWWSSAGIQALLAGVPVIYCGPWWIGARAAGRELGSVDSPVMGDREAMLEDVVNAQFSLEEIASGLPFKDLR